MLFEPGTHSHVCILDACFILFQSTQSKSKNELQYFLACLGVSSDNVEGAAGLVVDGLGLEVEI